jgi:hypothetical protein
MGTHSPRLAPDIRLAPILGQRTLKAPLLATRSRSKRPLGTTAPLPKADADDGARDGWIEAPGQGSVFAFAGRADGSEGVFWGIRAEPSLPPIAEHRPSPATRPPASATTSPTSSTGRLRRAAMVRRAMWCAPDCACSRSTRSGSRPCATPWSKVRTAGRPRPSTSMLSCGSSASARNDRLCVHTARPCRPERDLEVHGPTLGCRPGPIATSGRSWRFARTHNADVDYAELLPSNGGADMLPGIDREPSRGGNSWRVVLCPNTEVALASRVRERMVALEEGACRSLAGRNRGSDSFRLPHRMGSVGSAARASKFRSN